jgi:UDP-glucuronate 4-epimerase
MKILVTGSAGFIGYHVVSNLIQIQRIKVYGLDVINDYYDRKLKLDRLAEHGIDTDSLELNKFNESKIFSNYLFVKADICDSEFITSLFNTEKFDYVIHLAAQAGVRYSIDFPSVYVDSNIKGFFNILEGCRLVNCKHFLFASTSSVYGTNARMPLNETFSTDFPMSFYAATKKANEVMAHSYSHLFGIPSTGLRFFTVYGPWGRPDMALFLFTDAIIKNKPVKVFNYGKMVRDFTYIADLVHIITQLVELPPLSHRLESRSDDQLYISRAPYRVLNIGNSKPTLLMDYIISLEKHLGKTMLKEFIEIQAGDVPETHADNSELKKLIAIDSYIDINEGIENFVTWYLKYYKI